MAGQELFCVQASVVVLLLLLGQSLAIPPGGGEETCAVPDYPVNVRVLLDSWRYQSLLAGTRDTGWTAYNSDKNHNSSWYSDGECGESSVSVCNEAPGEKWLITPFILKNLPAPDLYSVRIFVNVTYSFMECTGTRCNEFELLLATYSSGERSAYESSVTAVSLALRSREACVTVSRVLVYLYECPDHNRQPTGLERRPATQAPVSGAVPVSPDCAENAHFSDFSNPNTLVCSSEGIWDNDQTHCKCDTGYSEDEEGTTCEKNGQISSRPPDIGQLSISISSTISVPHATSTFTSSSRKQASLIPSTPTPVADGPTSPSTTGTESSEVIYIAVFAGVGGTVGVVIIALLLAIFCVTAAKRKQKNKSVVEYNYTGELCTTENVAYAGTAKPPLVATQNPVYEEIPSGKVDTDGSGDPDTTTNVAYEIRSNVIRTAHNPAYEEVVGQNIVTSST